MSTHCSSLLDYYNVKRIHSFSIDIRRGCTDPYIYNAPHYFAQDVDWSYIYLKFSFYTVAFGIESNMLQVPANQGGSLCLTAPQPVGHIHWQGVSHYRNSGADYISEEGLSRLFCNTSWLSLLRLEPRAHFSLCPIHYLWRILSLDRPCTYACVLAYVWPSLGNGRQATAKLVWL